MKHTVSLIAILAILLATIFTSHAQDPVTLQFTGQNQYGQYVPLSTVTVENVTRHWQEMLYYPDTTLFIGQTGIEEIEQLSDGVRLFQNVPNPFDGVTDFVLYLPEASAVLLEICDLNGIVTATYSGSLDPGSHRFRSWLASPQTYLLNARTDGGTIQIKMVNAGRAGQNRLEYLGKGETSPMAKSDDNAKGNTNLPFNYGDIMSYIGHAHIADAEFTSATETKEQYNSELLPLTFTLPLPIVTTEAASNILSTEAWLNGSVIENAEYPVTERGFQLADNEQLTGMVQLIATADSENFHYEAHDLQNATRYYYRAYAQTALGFTFGDMRFFDTESEPPVVQTFAVENITSHSATCGGEVTADGGADVTSRGICWSTLQNPTINDNYTNDGTGTGVFSSILTELSPNTSYYVRAYATNSIGTAYGQQTSFTTLTNLPEVSTGNITNITASSATCGGNVISDGGDIVTARGICWSTSQNPMLNDSHTEEGTGTGYFSSNITGLTAGTTYYVRAYATNSAGTAYGQETFFTALANLPEVSTSSVTNITFTTATCGGQVTGTGGLIVTARGVCWSTSHNPTTNDNYTTNGTGLGVFSSTLTGLSSNTTYYVRAYATNNAGTAYGSEMSFTTEEIIIPEGDAQPCPNTPTVTDHEGNVYNTVRIGNQCWMKENLRTTTSPSTGTYLITNTDYFSTITGKKACWYNYDSAMYAPMNYGVLYNWNAAVDTFNTAFGETEVAGGWDDYVSVSFTSHRRGICPAGWHLPNRVEWIGLADYVGSLIEYTCDGNSSYIAKALASTEGWITSSDNCAVGNNPSSNNATGFSAVPAGFFEDFPFYLAGRFTAFWSSTEADFSAGRSFDLLWWDSETSYCNGGVVKFDFASVRCLRDTITLPLITTGSVIGITATTAICGGDVLFGGGENVSARGVCWSTSQHPTINDSHTTDSSGIGSFYSFLSGLSSSTTYYVRAYSTNSAGTAYGAEAVFTTKNLTPGYSEPCPGTLSVTDYEGNLYNTMQIGNQCWMRENLRTTHFPNGTTIPNGIASGMSLSSPYYYDYSSHPLPLETRGYLYNWPAAMAACPTGWHLPSDAEWADLASYMSNQSYYVCGEDTNHIAKALASIEGWRPNSNYDVCSPGNQILHTNNVSGFSAIPAGNYLYDGSFQGLGDNTGFWSSTESTATNAWVRGLTSGNVNMYRNNTFRYYGYSVRCLRD